ncbi:uncharacterized protein MELLADRAFT_111463 [Melampsora larici-populina 98AG31]|uniref:U1-type domain-containing protein n=1 Tax=Melampsora larici-populina (strain 98AG31 / pathotype 3-4-7) TaxID=747676 RepID=F4S397_MELLP|nr:uncharacterized protein MELLADRAFT_111463 [Melampsora larici-populina 98AG31]EGG00947.1 hypothetical protein MELLADRAFT_111463 [Melampsora larici-populina 98AG31]
MLRHIQNQVTKHTLSDGEVLAVGGSDSDSDSSSSESSSESCSSDAESTSEPQAVPQSLLHVLDHPLCSLSKLLGRNNEDPDSSEPEGENASSGSDDEEAGEAGLSGCVICPGKRLKTNNLATQHLKSKAHLRRLERYRDFIHNPPPHTLLSPDPMDVVDLLDSLTGPPPVLPPGTKSTSSKGKRKKREKRRARRLLSTEKPSMGKSSEVKVDSIAGEAARLAASTQLKSRNVKSKKASDTTKRKRARKNDKPQSQE